MTNGSNGNLVGVAPGLGGMADNGGPTQTIALLPGSPAIGTGSVALASGYSLTTDQQGTLASSTAPSISEPSSDRA